MRIYSSLQGVLTEEQLNEFKEEVEKTIATSVEERLSKVEKIAENYVNETVAEKVAENKAEMEKVLEEQKAELARKNDKELDENLEQFAANPETIWGWWYRTWADYQGSIGGEIAFSAPSGGKICSIGYSLITPSLKLIDAYPMAESGRYPVVKYEEKAISRQIASTNRMNPKVKEVRSSLRN